MHEEEMSSSHEFSYDVLICYRRTDSEFARTLSDHLRSRFGINSFIDQVEHIYGLAWRPLWRQALSRPVQAELAPGLGPTVVVLATPAAAERKEGGDIVVEEIWEALHPQKPINEVPIIVLRFGADGWMVLDQRLRDKAIATGGSYSDLDHARLNRLHQPDAFEQSWLRADLDEDAWNAICRPIIHLVRPYFTRLLSKEREKTEAWAKSVLSRQLAGEADDFARYQPSRGRADLAVQELAAGRRRNVVVVGPGGLGKTTQVARSILAVIASPHGTSFFPVVLTGEEVDSLDVTLARRLELKWLAHDSNVSLSDEGLTWFRDKLCFVTDSLERADEVAKTARQLERLRCTAKLLITTRPEAWTEAKRQLAVDPKDDVFELDEIGMPNVASYLGVDRGGSIEKLAYLRNPVFLDIAKYLSQMEGLDFRVGLETETDLLDAFKRFSIEPPSGRPLPEVQDRLTLHRSFLATLADQQLRRSRLDVPLDAIAGEETATAVRYLSEERKLAIVDGFGQHRTIRLRHDIIDAHNIADLLRDDPGRLPEALGKLQLGFGQIACGGIVQAAHDRQARDASAAELIDAFFNEFLRLVDSKKNPSLKAGGWNSGYVISAKLHVFEEHIKRILGGEYLGETEPDTPDRSLSGIRPPRVTQFALSSVASTLAGARPLEIKDPDGAFFRAIAEKIPRVKNRGRLIEGLAKIQRPDEVVELLGAFADDADLIRGDRALAGYIATALADVARASTEHRTRIEPALARLAGYFETDQSLASATILRDIERAISEVAALQGKRAKGPPPLSVAEVTEGLSNVAPDRPDDFSDWVTVENYLGEVGRCRGIVEGKVHDAVILAIGRVLWHQHLRCHEKAARALGAIDHPMARGLLLHVLTFETEERPEREIIEALRRQTDAVSMSGPRRVRFRLAFLRTLAQREQRVGRQRLDELAGVLQRLGDDDVAIVTEAFIELKRFMPRAPTFVLDPERVPLGVPAWLTAGERNADVGEEREAKIAFRLNQAVSDSEVLCVRSSWRSPRRFHVALSERHRFFDDVCTRMGVTYTPRPSWDIWRDRDSKAFTEHLEAVARMHAAFEDGIELPTFAALHAALVTSDGVVIEAMRSSKSEYQPGVWAVSFEEQITREDIEGGLGLLTCLLRGIEEEMGVRLRSDEVGIEASSIGIEWAIGNTVVLVIAKLNLSEAEFRQRMHSDGHDQELSAFRYSPAAVELQFVDRSELPYWLFRNGEDCHPTTGARLVLMRISQRHAGA